MLSVGEERDFIHKGGMIELFTEDDRESLQRGAHSLKSTSAALGATNLARLAAGIESLAHGRKALNEANSAIAAAEAEFENVRRELLTTCADVPARKMTGA
jgi:HPt (histidine-containing phosphotransfer) domain-containing protein